MITIHNISINYGNKSILKDISLIMPANGLISVIGENGTGKSSLLKAILNEISFEGEIKLNGNSLKEIDDTSKDIAISISGRPSIPGMSVMEILQTGRYPYLERFAVFSDEDNVLIKRYSDKFNLAELLDRKFTTLSDGEAQKVMIARAFIQDTKILLLDEPSASLDIKQKQFLFRFLKEEAKERLIICVTHDIREALEFSDEFWLVANKEVISFSANNNELKQVLKKEFDVEL